jgi:hypothetical protein
MRFTQSISEIDEGFPGKFRFKFIAKHALPTDFTSKCRLIGHREDVLLKEFMMNNGL